MDNVVCMHVLTRNQPRVAHRHDDRDEPRLVAQLRHDDDGEAREEAVVEGDVSHLLRIRTS